MSARISSRLRLYGREAEGESLPWLWVQSRLEEAPMYWLSAAREDHTPHARPVWGVWLDGQLLLSVGSWVLWRFLKSPTPVSVHLESASEVVILEGMTAIVTDKSTIIRFVEIYNPKYDWSFKADDVLSPIAIEPNTILAWEAKGVAGRDGFGRTGKWEFHSERR